MTITISEGLASQLENVAFYAWRSIEATCDKAVADDCPTLDEALSCWEKREKCFGREFVLGDILDVRKELFGDDPITLIKDLYESRVRFIGLEEKSKRRVKGN